MISDKPIDMGAKNETDTKNKKSKIREGKNAEEESIEDAEDQEN